MATRQNSTNGKPKSPRIQVVLPELICEQLTILANNESRTVSNMAKVLIQEGIKKYFENEDKSFSEKNVPPSFWEYFFIPSCINTLAILLTVLDSLLAKIVNCSHINSGRTT